MLVHTARYLRERGQHATSVRYFAQEMNWGNAAIGKINSVLHGLEADIKAGASTITDPQFLEDGWVKKFSLVLANFPFSDDFWWLKPEQQTDDKKKKAKLKKEIFGKEGFKDPFGRFGRGTGFKAPPAGYGDYAFILHILASLTGWEPSRLARRLRRTGLLFPTIALSLSPWLAYATIESSRRPAGDRIRRAPSRRWGGRASAE